MMASRTIEKYKPDVNHLLEFTGSDEMKLRGLWIEDWEGDTHITRTHHCAPTAYRRLVTHRAVGSVLTEHVIRFFNDFEVAKYCPLNLPAREKTLVVAFRKAACNKGQKTSPIDLQLILLSDYIWCTFQDLKMANEVRLYPILVLNPNSSEEESKQAYDHWASTYEEDTRIYGYKGHALCLEAFDKAMESADVFPEVHKEIKILDAGAGTGIMGEMLVERGFTNVDGLDVSQEMLNFAKSKNVYKRIICAPLSEIVREEIQTAEYDVVLCAGTIVYGQVKSAAIDECVRFVKPGGLFIFTIRVESYDPVEYGFSTKCEELEKEGKLNLVCKERRELYSNPTEEKYRDCYLITYKVIKN